MVDRRSAGQDETSKEESGSQYAYRALDFGIYTHKPPCAALTMAAMARIATTVESSKGRSNILPDKGKHCSLVIQK